MEGTAVGMRQRVLRPSVHGWEGPAVVLGKHRGLRFWGSSLQPQGICWLYPRHTRSVGISLHYVSVTLHPLVRHTCSLTINRDAGGQNYHMTKVESTVRHDQFPLVAHQRRSDVISPSSGPHYCFSPEARRAGQPWLKLFSQTLPQFLFAL